MFKKNWKIFRELNKYALVYLKRARGLVATMILLPLLFLLIGTVLGSTANVYFYYLAYSFSSLTITLITASQVGFELNDSSLYRKILLYKGMQKWTMFAPLVSVLAIQILIYVFLTVLIQIFILTIYQKNALLQGFYLPGITYGYFGNLFVALFFATFLYTSFKNREAVYLVSIFLSILCVLLSDGFIFRFGEFFQYTSYINPFKYSNITIFQSANMASNYNNYFHAGIFDLKPVAIVKYRFFAQSSFISDIIFDKAIIMYPADKVLNLLMPWVLAGGFAYATTKLDLLKRSKYH